MTDLGLEGRGALVTGGTRGIGRAIAARLLEAGATVTVCARREPERPLPDGIAFIAADLRDLEGAAAAVDAAVEHAGRLDAVVNNAGGGPPTDAAEMSPRLAQAIVGLNLLAPFHVAQRAHGIMRAQPEGGQIVNVGSVGAIRPAPGTALYAAAKAGVTTLTRALALEWGPHVRVNQVTPGIIRTEDSEQHYAGAYDEIAETIPLRRMGHPDDVAGACLLLLSPLGAYVNGAELTVDGGGETPAWLVAMRAAAERGGGAGPAGP